MKEFESRVSPKGQITLPAEVRRQLGLKPKDKVSILVEGDEVRVGPARSRLDESYQAVSALDPDRSLREITDIAAEEHAQHVAQEGV